MFKLAIFSSSQRFSWKFTNAKSLYCTFGGTGTVEKRKDFGQLTDNDLGYFRGLLGDNGVKTEELEEYNTDFMRWYKGQSRCVLLPQTVEEVSALLKHCYQRRLAIVPQGGNTGLVGGSVPVFDEIILSTKRLTTNFVFDANSSILDCDSGFILEEADNRLANEGFMVPVDLGAKGSCLVGGIVSTNAGGIRLIRYGSMHAHVTGLEVVIPDSDGTVLKFGSHLRKDNTELHLHKLFVGSEGQLGVITRVQMQVVPRPISVQSAFIAVPSFTKCLQILNVARQQFLTEILSSFELVDAQTLRMVEENAGLTSPFPNEAAFYLLIETSGTDPEHDSAKMERFLSHCIGENLAADGVLAQSATEAEHLWKIRENCSLALRQDGYVFKHDISLPLSHFYELTEVVRERLAETKTVKRICTFGHLGDGNTHLNVTASVFDEHIYGRLYPFIYEWVASKGGSISAEHGIGRLKREYHHKLVHPKRRAISAQIKRLFDPRLILSPYKMID